MCPKSRVGVDNPWWTISVENWSIIWCPNGSSSHQIITSPPDGWPHIVMCDGAAGANANNHVMYHTQKYLKACSAHLFSKNQSQKTSMFYRVGFPLTGFDPQERNFGLVLSHSCKWEIYVPVTFRSSLTPWGLTAVADRRDLPGGLTAVADLDCSGELCLIPVVSSKVLLCPPLAMGKYLYAVLKTSTWAWGRRFYCLRKLNLALPI